MRTTVVWLRRDLRLDDNPALAAAAKRGAVAPVYIWAPDEEDGWPLGGASKWWLHHSLERLGAELERLGSKLILRRGDSLAELEKIASECGADAVYWNRRYEPHAVKRDKQIKATLRKQGLEVESFNGFLLWEPWEIETKTAGPYKVFTPYYRACLQSREPETPIEAPTKLPAPRTWPSSNDLNSFELEPRINWASGIAQSWSPGEAGARDALRAFAGESVAGYAHRRDAPSIRGTSRLSPHLCFGEISPRSICAAVRERYGSSDDAEPYLRQLVWREFAQQLLYHFPHTPEEPLRPEYARFPWADNAEALKRWQQGRTGYPIVDAGMRELWTTGWMHNRVRMIVASFLVKDLLIPWQEGARWFWDTLVDADLGNNTLGWQWAAGCGADAAPYFRIFNPVKQGEKFDPNGDYVRRWIPELKDLPNEWIHAPWTAPPLALQEASVRLGDTYPRPIVDHSKARDRALEALQRMREETSKQ